MLLRVVIVQPHRRHSLVSTYLRSQIRIPGMVLWSIFYSQLTRILDSRVLSKYEKQWAKPQYNWLLYQRGLASGFGKGVTDYQEDFPGPCLEICLKKQKFLLCYCFCCFVSANHHSSILRDPHLRLCVRTFWELLPLLFGSWVIWQVVALQLKCTEKGMDVLATG